MEKGGVKVKLMLAVNTIFSVSLMVGLLTTIRNQNFQNTKKKIPLNKNFSLFFIYNCDGGQTLEQIVQRDWEVSILGAVENQTENGLGQPADLALTRGLD